MPDHLWLPASVRAFVRDIADPELRRAIKLALIELPDDPLPPEAREFQADGEPVEYAYELDVDPVTIFYTVDGGHVSVQEITWRVL